MNHHLILKQKLCRVASFLCAAGLFCLAQGTSFAQDDPGEPLQPDSGRSQPGVVQRVAPQENTKSEPEEEIPPAPQNDAHPSTGDAQSGVVFGEQYQFENNFGDLISPKPTPSNVKITLDFRDADLGDVVKLMSAQTGRNFIIADSLRAGKKITIISPNPVSAGEAYQAFLSALQMNGLTVVQSGKFYKIIDTATGQKEPISPSWDDVSIFKND